MKKGIFLSMAIILVCCLVSTVYAEAFQLRNGILFGDSLETVKGKEQLELKEDESLGVTYYCGYGTVAGFDGEVDFYFGDSDALSDMSYKFRNVGGSAENIYSTLRDSITNKYGESLGNANGKTHLITGKAFEDAEFTVSAGKMFGQPGGYLGYDEWLVECDGGAVKIDLVYYYSRDVEMVALSYRFCSSEEIDGLLQEQQDHADAINGDI